MTSTQRIVAGFFISVWVLIVAVRFAASDTLRAALGIDDPAVSVFMAGISVLIAVVLIGIVRRWRWVFWLVLVACLGGVLRVPASALELAGIIATALPPWYVALQAIIGVAQIGVAAAMIRGYRRLGVWD
jgi:hypothetical protein